MSDRINRIIATIDTHIYVWSSVPSYAPMAQVLLKNRDMLAEKLLELTEGGLPKGAGAHDAVRAFLMDFALERVSGQIRRQHFTILRHRQAVEAIFKDFFGGGQSPADPDQLLFPHQDEALKILTRCLFRRAGAADEKELLCFLHMFSRAGLKACPDQDTSMRLTAMLWFIYLAIEIVQTESGVCLKGPEYFSKRFSQLLGRTIAGTLAGGRSGRPGFEEGKWEKTLFGRLQGKGGNHLARELKDRFNMEDRLEQVNGRLLADHRNAILEQTLVMFCKQARVHTTSDAT